METKMKSKEILNCELRFDDFIKPENTREITSSKTYRDGIWAQLTKLQGFTPGIEKSVLPVDAKQFRILVLTTAKPGTDVPMHSHDEEILRYVIKGSLTINDVIYRAGEWVLIPKNYSYGIQTEEGYTTIAGYGVACGAPQ